MNMNEILDRVSSEHPYKIPGDRDSYSQYNEAWQDCIARIEQELELMQRENQFEFCFDNVKSFDCPCGRHYINTTAAHKSGNGEITEYCQKEYEDALKEDAVSKEFLAECKRAADKYRRNNDGWIPVEKFGLPNSNEHDFRFWVTIQYGNGFRRTIKAKWDCFDKCFMHHNGKKILQDVIAYKYYSAPEPYHPERSDNHDGK